MISITLELVRVAAVIDDPDDAHVPLPLPSRALCSVAALGKNLLAFGGPCGLLTRTTAAGQVRCSL
jgi:hypothetical protein